ncbi:MAG: integral rane sensor hybrid histidine kinase [Sphingomonas bacterium]|jgi:signal transduction histidine kinase/CheY-like chemotaxis protein|nr:integral rane sensor hybrid histidine kinase [Sphingomonas bacterium]
MGLMDRDDDAIRDSSGWRRAALAIVTLIAAALIVGLVVKVALSNRDRDHALQQERHSYDVMLLTSSAGSSMASAEAALGRYAISADRGMGSRYYNDWVLAGAQIDKLATLVSRNPQEQALVVKLQALYVARGKELGQPATRAFYRQGWPALNLFNAAGHSKLIGEIDRTLQAITDYERARLERRYDQSDAASMDANFLIWLLSLAGLALIVAAGALGWAMIVAMARHRQAQDEADAADDRAAWLETAVAERTRALSTANTLLQHEMVTRATAEAQLRQIQKMEAVGQLTGGIAHDFNNMLAVVVGGLDLAKRRLEAEADEVGRHIDNALEGANRAAALTRRLMGFARAEPLLPEAADPGRLIEGMSDLIDRTLGERVTVETRIAPDVWPIWVDPMQFENAILNLAVNARDAMDGAGTLVIAVDNVVLTPGEVTEIADGGEHARIRVTDTGTGMTPEILERVFEPFFTTKPVGKGTGLGLSQIFGFVRQSGGDVAITSAPGEGTIVSLYLPRGHVVPAAPRAVAPPVPIRPAPAPTSSGEPILVVEDDPRVRAATVAALEELDYRPIPCGDAEEALATLATRADIRLIVTDVVMPGMTGPELVAEVRTLYPAIGVLFVTGYAGEAGGDELEGQAVLRKPFTIAALEQAMAEAIGRIEAGQVGGQVSGRRPAPGAAAAG